MKKLFLCFGLLWFSAMLSAQTMTEWQDPNINEVNRASMHSSFFAFENEEAAQKGAKEQSENFMSLNGLWKFNWVKDADMRPTDFWKCDFNDRG